MPPTIQPSRFVGPMAPSEAAPRTKKQPARPRCPLGQQSPTGWVDGWSRPISKPTLMHYNRELEALRSDINDTMNPLQRGTARTLAVIGTLGAIGGSVTAGVLGMTALVSAASVVGLPIAAAAGIAGATVGLCALGLTLLASAGVRKLLRRNVAKSPKLADRMVAARALRAALVAKPELTAAEKQLLRNVNYVVGKLEGFKPNLKAQMKTMAITGAAATVGIFIFALFAAAGGGGGGPIFGGFGHGGTSLSGGFDGGGGSLEGAKGDIDLGDNHQHLLNLAH